VTFCARSGLLLALAGAHCALVVGCQKADDHAPFVQGCTSDCKPTLGISVGSGSAGGTSVTPPSDASFDAGTLTGSVVALADDTFTRASPFTQAATVSADGASGSSVSAIWNGTDPYALSGVSVVDTNWVSVTPTNIQGDAMQTFQAVQTNATGVADLAVVDAAAIDSVLFAVSMTKAPALGQVVLFFRNKGTGAPLSGVRAEMSAAAVPAYAATSGWVFADDTTTTSASGLVVFGNVALPPAGSTTQLVTVSRPATATTPAISGGQFSVKVVEGAVTLASVAVQL
jgi:hypothetical protein